MEPLFRKKTGLAARSLFLRHQAQLAARPRPGRPPPRRRGELRLRHRRHLAPLATHRRPKSTPPTSRTLPARSSSTLRTGQVDDDELPEDSQHPARGVARGPLQQRGLRSTPSPFPRSAAFPSRASPATSRPRSSAKPVSAPVSPRTPTAPAASCSCTPANNPSSGETPTALHHRMAPRPVRPLEYALEGGVFIGGAVVQWLRDGLGLIANSAAIEALAAQRLRQRRRLPRARLHRASAPRTGTPAARGAIVGLTRGSTAAHLARAALEKHRLPERRSARAPCRPMRNSNFANSASTAALRSNGALMQFQADLLRVSVVRPRRRRNHRPGRRLSRRPRRLVPGKTAPRSPPMGRRPPLPPGRQPHRDEKTPVLVAPRRRAREGLGAMNLSPGFFDHVALSTKTIGWIVLIGSLPVSWIYSRRRDARDRARATAHLAKCRRSNLPAFAATYFPPTKPLSPAVCANSSAAPPLRPRPPSSRRPPCRGPPHGRPRFDVHRRLPPLRREEFCVEHRRSRGRPPGAPPRPHRLCRPPRRRARNNFPDHGSSPR